MKHLAYSLPSKDSSSPPPPPPPPLYFFCSELRIDRDSLTVRLGRVVTAADDEIFRLVVVAARQVAVEDALGAVGVPLLRVDRRARHVRHHGVAAARRVLGRSERMVARRRLWEPHVAAVAVEMARAQGFGDVFLDDDTASGGVDEVGA